jgi:hypothetical protein
VTLRIERRHRTRRGGYWQMPWQYSGDLSPYLEATLPPLSTWTAQTVRDMVAQTRAALVARGAQGRCTVSARFNDPWVPENITLSVRVGALRATVVLEWGVCRCRHLPRDLVAACHAVAPTPTSTHWFQIIYAGQ